MWAGALGGMPSPLSDPDPGVATGSSEGATVVLLTPHWESASERGWFTRQVAGALAAASKVHVVTPEGRRPTTSSDSVFTVHRTAHPIDPSSELARDLLVEALGAIRTATRTPGRTDATSAPPVTSVSGVPEVPAAVAPVLDRDLVEPWTRAAETVRQLNPALAVVAGYRNVGALAALEGCRPDLPVVLVALGDTAEGVGFPHFAPLFERAASVITTTETERAWVVARGSSPASVHRVGAPMAANSSALSEPNTWVGDTGYLLVLTNVDSNADHEETELARLLRIRFPWSPVGVAHRDAFFAWHEGRVNRGWPIERASDLSRLMAWAAVTIDLHPGSLFGRRCVESLLFRTPIVVPVDSIAREHAERGRGGLWFDGPAELLWCVEALGECEVRRTLAAQGHAYAEEEFGSTNGFIDRVTRACGLEIEDLVDSPS